MHQQVPLVFILGVRNDAEFAVGRPPNVHGKVRDWLLERQLGTAVPAKTDRLRVPAEVIAAESGQSVRRQRRIEAVCHGICETDLPGVVFRQTKFSKDDQVTGVCHPNR